MTPTTMPPILPHTPWYRSDVQLHIVLSLAAQAGSISVRLLEHWQWLSGLWPGSAADIGQLVAIGFGLYAAIRRGSSTIAPLTLTAAGAVKQSADNPAIMAETGTTI